MSTSELLLPEFDQEMAGTRKALERIPDDKLDWKAHPKSNTIGWNATHLANLPSWATITMKQNSLDLNPVGGEPFKTDPAGSRAEILDLFDKNLAEARGAIADASEEDWRKDWSLLSRGETLFTMPRYNVIRTWVINHIVHHRAILTVYYRLNDVPVPALYGPSGDEEG